MGAFQADHPAWAFISSLGTTSLAIGSGVLTFKLIRILYWARVKRVYMSASHMWFVRFMIFFGLVCLSQIIQILTVFIPGLYAYALIKLILGILTTCMCFFRDFRIEVESTLATQIVVSAPRREVTAFTEDSA